MFAEHDQWSASKIRVVASTRAFRTRSLICFCMPSHKSGPLPQSLPSRTAISGLMACSPAGVPCGESFTHGEVNLLKKYVEILATKIISDPGVDLSNVTPT